MKIVSAQTGLSPHVLRVWEKRYSAVSPFRTESNRRIYTDDELRRLKNLSLLTGLGYSIGQIAKLPCQELQLLISKHQDEKTLTAESASSKSSSAVENQFITKAIQATKAMDQQKMMRVFDEATLTLGYSGLLERILIPFMKHVGDLWQQGAITASDEHAASCAVKDYLASTARPFSASADAPRIIVATPTGQLHEIGAVIVSNLAKKLGWNVTYLGASLPAIEIASAAIKRKARAVALSIIYPADDPHLEEELETLSKHIPSKTSILAGGRSATNYQSCFDRLDISHVTSVTHFNEALIALREAPGEIEK